MLRAHGSGRRSPRPPACRRTRRVGDRVGDGVLYGLTGARRADRRCSIIAAIVWRVADGAWPAIKEFHLGFLWHNEWNPVDRASSARAT